LWAIRVAYGPTPTVSVPSRPGLIGVLAYWQGRRSLWPYMRVWLVNDGANRTAAASCDARTGLPGGPLASPTPPELYLMGGRVVGSFRRRRHSPVVVARTAILQCPSETVPAMERIASKGNLVRRHLPADLPEREFEARRPTPFWSGFIDPVEFLAMISRPWSDVLWLSNNYGKEAILACGGGSLTGRFGVKARPGSQSAAANAASAAADSSGVGSLRIGPSLHRHFRGRRHSRRRATRRASSPASSQAFRVAEAAPVNPESAIAIAIFRAAIVVFEQRRNRWRTTLGLLACFDHQPLVLGKVVRSHPSSGLFLNAKASRFNRSHRAARSYPEMANTCPAAETASAR